jgi:hypothetical protein
MELVTNLLIAVLLLTVLSGCGGGGGGSDFAPTDPNTVFEIEKPGGQSIGSSDSYTLSGTDSDGDDWILSVSSQVQADTTFLGEPVRSIFSIVQVKYLPTGEIANTSGTSYYKYDAGGFYFIGDSGDATTVANTTNLAPYSVKIGDLGEFGTYTNNVGDETTITWELADGGNGLAYWIVRSTTFDQYGNLTAGTEETVLINPDGTVVSRNVTFSYFDFGFTIEFSD